MRLRWHATRGHVLCVSRSGEARLYVDGRLVAVGEPVGPEGAVPDGPGEDGGDADDWRKGVEPLLPRSAPHGRPPGSGAPLPFTTLLRRTFGF